MIRFTICRRELVTIAGYLLLLAVQQPAIAQPGPKAAVKQPVKKSPPAEKAAATPERPIDEAGEPATVAAAARVLDLRTLPVMEGANVNSMRTLGMLMYEAKGTPKSAFEFQRQQLRERGFQESPGGYSDATNNFGQFTKNGFHVAVSTSEISGEPQKAGWSRVSLINDGNLALNKLPVPPEVKPFYPQSFRAAYTTDAKVAETAAACRKLLLAAGWEPYGEAGSNANDPDSSMYYFKRNAIKLLSWVSITPAEGGKTLIRYQTELLSADLPAPPDVPDPRYTDFQKTLRFDAPKEQTDAIVAFYQERLHKLGWKATTERPIVDDRTKSQFVIYRNAEQEMLSLDLTQFTGIVRVSLKHQTAAEVAEEERLFKEHAEREKQEQAKRNVKIKIAVPLPAAAQNLEKQRENRFEFQLATGSGPAALRMFRDHFIKEDWTEEKRTELKENIGSMNLTKGESRLDFSYFDSGFTNAEISVGASSNIILEPTPSKENLANAPTAAKKSATPAVPGLPTLPPGLELPDDVNALLKKALQESANKQPAPAKKPGVKK